MKKYVLLIDDDETLLELGKEMFDILNIQALTAFDMDEAVRCFKCQHNNIGLVIFDLNLDQVSGIEVFEALKEIDADFDAVLASGIFIDEDAPKYIELGFKEIILKPYNLSTLKQLSEKYFNQDKRVNE
ncbi:MAG: response regulator [Candidatus Cloacimonetes bacterium]|jgi:DNA-binding NtrC family response regulator|nr:response regulator [Candidatus Cloacimonadota bacterium]MDD4155731.1 response regulator [Candidatus Cloacimonadota bacterium]